MRRAIERSAPRFAGQRNGWVLRVAASRTPIPGSRYAITTSTHLVDFRSEEVDMRPLGHGAWPGPCRADWLMAEHIFPVCSPALLNDARPLPLAGGPRAPYAVAHDGLR